MIIAIDGPAGSGKTTVAKALSEKLNVLYLDTGATYRSLTLYALDNGIDLSNESLLIEAAKKIKIRLEKNKVFLNEKDVSLDIRAPKIDANISLPVSFQGVREVMVDLQRSLVVSCDAVVEGRDITTVVFPAAEFKFYLDADVNERALRRYKELKQRNVDISLEEVTEKLKKRDKADFTRVFGPLKKADDAQIIDSSGMSIDQVVSKITDIVKK